MKKGIDVAKWNPIKDYAAVAREVSFAILKIINISNNEDGLFAMHLNGCRANNIPVIGVYNYSYATGAAKAQADANAVISVLRKYGLNATVWLDIEDQDIAKRIGAGLIDVIITYRETIKAAGYSFGVYTGLSYYKTYLKKYEDKLAGIPMWIARYPSTAKMTIDKNPTADKKPDVSNLYAWQYSSKGVVSGIAGVVDLDILYADEGVVTPTPATSAPAASEYYPRYTGVTNTSIISGLAGVGERDTSYAHRCKIAAANGITGYRGTAAQNLKMLSLLKQGKLKKG